MKIDTPIGLPFFYLSPYGDKNLYGDRHISGIINNIGEKFNLNIDDYDWSILNNKLVIKSLNDNVIISDYSVVSNHGIVYKHKEIIIDISSIRNDRIDYLLS